MNAIQVDIQAVQEKLVDKLRPSGWADKLKAFIMTEDFADILQKLKVMRDEDKRFTPPLKDVFAAFEQCPYQNLKVVVIGQDPYPQLGVADGIAFSCGKTMAMQPSLKYLLEAVEDTVYAGFPTQEDPNLARWANQGVLLLNTALTVEVNKVGSHYDLWQPFIAYVIDILSWNNPGLIWIFMGKKAQELESLVSSNHYKFEISHPASAAYQKASKWECEDVFNKTNKILEANNGSSFKIQW
jgi:uracil-DNA glycosylase